MHRDSGTDAIDESDLLADSIVFVFMFLFLYFSFFSYVSNYCFLS